MSQDSKFFVGVAVAAVLIIGGIVFFTSRHKTAPSAPVTVDASRGHQKGEAGAPVTIVEFGDLQCPACGAAEPFVRQMLVKHTDVKFSFIHFPLPMHPNAVPAAQAAEAADKQGKFWEMHDMLYDRQTAWSSVANSAAVFEGYARELGLNLTRFTADYNASAVKEKIKSDSDYGSSLSVDQTPTFFVNGVRVTGAQTASNWDELINTALKK